MKMKTLFMLLAFCAAALQTVAQCNAGDDVTVELCGDDSPVDLFTKIEGFPDTNGYWEDPLGAAFVNPFDPALHGEGVYTYIVDTQFDGTPCPYPDQALVTVTVYELPTVTFLMDETTACGHITTQFENTSAGLGFNLINWDFGDGSTSISNDPLYTYSDTGIFDVTLTLSNAFGCESSHTDLAAINVLEAPRTSFTLAHHPITTLEPQGEFVNETEGAVQYSWNIPGIGNFSEENPQVDFPPFESSYFVCLEAIGQNGCVGSFCRSVFVRESKVIYTPSAFTADQNKLNDSFKPVLTFDPQLYEMTIFDRWGAVVFKTDEPSQGWGGNHLANEFFVPDNYYQWRIKAVKDGEVIEKVGHVTVLR